MLTLTSRANAQCDGISRRSFVTVGALGLGGLTLADLLRLEARSSPPVPPKSVIVVYLGGGPSHIDTYDLKPEAPAEYRGEFKPIQTRVSGLEISELMPMQAQIADKWALVRSLQMATSGHNDLEVMSGFLYRDAESGIGSISTGQPRPSFGAVVSRLDGASNRLPAYVSLMGGRSGEKPAYLGSAHRPFVPSGPDLDNLTLSGDVSLDRLAQRQALLRGFETLRRDLDARGEMVATDSFRARAIDMITSPRTRAAFDLSQESPQTRQKYGAANGAESLPVGVDRFLLARRLVEAGVRVVTLNFGSWDTHGNIFPALKGMVPVLDRALYGLVTDLHDRGLQDRVAVLMWGEFGRAPRITMFDGSPGRDHHGPANFAWFAGGGLRMGQLIGATDARGAQPRTKPYRAQNVLATLYHVLGIDTAQTFADPNGRPSPLLDEREPIAELV